MLVDSQEKNIIWKESISKPDTFKEKCTLNSSENGWEIENGWLG